MSYIEQVCDGYSKKTLMGNWYEEKLYPDQPFRVNPDKHVQTLLFRQEKKMKESLASITLASKDNCPDSIEKIIGKLQAELFLMMVS